MIFQWNLTLKMSNQVRVDYSKYITSASLTKCIGSWPLSMIISSEKGLRKVLWLRHLSLFMCNVFYPFPLPELMCAGEIPVSEPIPRL